MIFDVYDTSTWIPATAPHQNTDENYSYNSWQDSALQAAYDSNHSTSAYQRSIIQYDFPIALDYPSDTLAIAQYMFAPHGGGAVRFLTMGDQLDNMMRFNSYS